MKAIAEYFRDLAADDRFFGAEPPQPDTEMLHKIAERTIQRRVAAELAENGVILRQTEASQTQVAAAPALAVEMPQAPVQQAPVQAEQMPEPKADVMSSIADVPPPAPQPTPVRADTVGGDTVAQKLQRIRAVVARENATSAYSEDQHADGFTAQPDAYEDSAPSAFLDTTEAEFETDTPDADAPHKPVIDDTTEDMDVADLMPKDDDTVADAPAAEDSVEEAPTPDVVGDTSDAETDVETEAAPDVEPAQADDADIADQTAEVAADAEIEAEDANASEAPAAEVETEVEAEAEVEAETDSEAAAQSETPTLRTKPRRRIVVQKISRSDMEAAKAAKEAELPPELEAELMAELAEVEADQDDIVEADPTAQDGVAEATEDDGSAQDEADTQDDDMLARLNDTLSQDAAPKVEDAPVETSLEDESDDVLKGLLDAQSADEADTEVEAEQDAESDEDASEVKADAEDAPTEDDIPAAVEPTRKTLAAEAEDDAIERLMSTTGSRLDHDESSVRRASIAHLKAAVAATKADASIAEAADKREEEELGQYRDDLARVVKPSRPTAGSGRSDRPAPLVLVSEQRIDRPEEAPKEAVAASIDIRPRRVTQGNLALQEEDEFEVEEDALTEPTSAITYAEFAAKAGALELPDLLEAAAGHYMVVEGAAHFTRPMLMRKLATIQGPDAPSREDGLRAFGTLLRTGKIVKTDNGKFVLAKSSQFASEAL